MAFRSILFVPGNDARRLEKAFTAGADVVVLDLEDAVARSEKAAARAAVARALETKRPVPAYVRVNDVATPFCYADAFAIVGAGLAGIFLPTVERVEHLWAFDWLLGQLEAERGLPAGGIDLIPYIETATGLSNVDAIASGGTRARRMAFGAGDFTFDTGTEWRREETELAIARAAIVVASRTAKLEPPVDSVWVDLGDDEGFTNSARNARRRGFQGKMCIHPRQVQIANAVFTPAEEEIADARRIVAAFDEAEAAGSAAVVLDGRFIDYAIVNRAQRLLEANREERSVSRCGAKGRGCD